MMKKAENATQAVKRGLYAKPTLTRFGDVRDVTLQDCTTPGCKDDNITN